MIMNQYNGDDTPAVCIIGKIRVFEEALSWLRERGTNADWQHWVENCQLPFLETQRDQIHFSLLIVVTTLVEGILVAELWSQINCVSYWVYWVTRSGKLLLEMCCFNMGITQIVLETSENDLFLTLGSGASSARNKNLRPLLDRNIPLIRRKYGLRNHFWPLESGFLMRKSEKRALTF